MRETYILTFPECLLMIKDPQHVQIRDHVEKLLSFGVAIEEIAKMLGLPVGSRYIKNSAKWYRYCTIARRNQKKAVEKDPYIYSKAGRIAQLKHPWIGHKLGKKYGPIQGKLNSQRLKGNSEYFSMMAKRLHALDPLHSSKNMQKAHASMLKGGTFNKHQREAALRCMEKNPTQLQEMSRTAHNLYPLGLLALESRRRSCPYRFMSCLFDSGDEMRLCKRFVESNLMAKPVEGINVHFRINRHHVDFFIKNRLFVEYHPPMMYGRKKGETVEGYYKEKRKILDDNGFKDYPLMVIVALKGVDSQIECIKKLVSLKLGK